MPRRRPRPGPSSVLVCARAPIARAPSSIVADVTVAQTSAPPPSPDLTVDDPHPTAPREPRPAPRPPSWSPFGFLRDGPFGFLRDGTRSLKHGSSPAAGTSNTPALFPPRQADGGLLSGLPQTKRPEKETDDDPTSSESLPPSQPASHHRLPAWRSWRDWKKVTLDVYLRLTNKPLYSRVRLKQTVALLPVVKLKPVIDLGYRGPDAPPFAMHLDIKLLDCIKYRVRPDGNAFLQVRAKAPLADPRFRMDVLYQRDLATSLETVKITFRMLDVAFLKAPGIGAGFKYPIRFDNGIKTTLRVKKYLVESNQPKPTGRKQSRPMARWAKGEAHSRGGAPGDASPMHHQMETIRNKYRIEGPIGFDIKFRCLEYR